MTDSTVPRRYGITIPFNGIPMHEHREWIELLADRGYTDVTAGEAGANDGFTPLVLTAAWAPTLRLSHSILPVFTRGPALLAQSIASLCDAAPGRVAVGIGASSNVIVEQWNGIPFDRPYARVRDTIRFLRAALAGEKVTEDYETFSVKGFRSELVPSEPPPILVAALRSKMLRLAGTEGDGAILNWLSARRHAQDHRGGRPRQRDHVPHVRVPHRGLRARAQARDPAHERVPQRARVPRVPGVAGPHRGAHPDVGRVG